MVRNSQRGSKNNNPEGHNQYTNGWADTARDRPMATAAAAAAAVGAGVFLWSRRNQISEQIGTLSDQFAEWAGSQQFPSSQSGSSGEFEYAESGSGTSAATGTATGSTTGSTTGSNSGKGKGPGLDSTSGNASRTTTGAAI